MPSRARLYCLKAVLSLFLIYHLLAVSIVPNGQTYLGGVLAPGVEPYIKFLEFGNSWSFFAPEPGPPPVFVEYELLDHQGNSFERGRWPEMPDPFWIRERQNRRIAAAEFMMANEVRAEKMMLYYLCAHKPGTHSMRVWRVMYSIPDFQEVLEGKRVIGDEVRMERKLVSHSFCEGSK